MTRRSSALHKINHGRCSFIFCLFHYISRWFASNIGTLTFNLSLIIILFHIMQGQIQTVTFLCYICRISSNLFFDYRIMVWVLSYHMNSRASNQSVCRGRRQTRSSQNLSSTKIWEQLIWKSLCCLALYSFLIYLMCRKSLRMVGNRVSSRWKAFGILSAIAAIYSGSLAHCIALFLSQVHKRFCFTDVEFITHLVGIH